jgi:hypothetical protein
VRRLDESVRLTCGVFGVLIAAVKAGRRGTVLLECD